MIISIFTLKMLRSRYCLRLIFPRTRRRFIQHLLQEATLLLKIIITKNHNVFVSKEGENFNITIGKRIKICRKSRAMTGNQLGRAIGLNKAFGTRITQYETNARIPRPEILKKLQMFLTLVCFQSHRSSETCRRNLWKSCSGWMKNSGLPFPTTNTLPSRILIGIRTFSPA